MEVIPRDNLLFYPKTSYSVFGDVVLMRQTTEYLEDT